MLQLLKGPTMFFFV